MHHVGRPRTQGEAPEDRPSDRGASAAFAHQPGPARPRVPQGAARGAETPPLRCPAGSIGRLSHAWGQSGVVAAAGWPRESLQLQSAGAFPRAGADQRRRSAWQRVPTAVCDLCSAHSAPFAPPVAPTTAAALHPHLPAASCAPATPRPRGRGPSFTSPSPASARPRPPPRPARTRTRSCTPCATTRASAAASASSRTTSPPPSRRPTSSRRFSHPPAAPPRRALALSAQRHAGAVVITSASSSLLTAGVSNGRPRRVGHRPGGGLQDPGTPLPPRRHLRARVPGVHPGTLPWPTPPPPPQRRRRLNFPRRPALHRPARPGAARRTLRPSISPRSP